MRNPYSLVMMRMMFIMTMIGFAMLWPEETVVISRRMLKALGLWRLRCWLLNQDPDDDRFDELK